MCRGNESKTTPQSSDIHVVSFAVPEGPILPTDFDQIDEEILRAQAGGLCQYFGHAFVEEALLLRLAAGAQRDLNKDDAIGPRNAEVLRVVHKAFGGMLGYNLKMVIGRDGERFNHRAMNAIADGPAKFHRGALKKRDANEWHRNNSPAGLDARKQSRGTNEEESALA
jgi:hypothetical protein